MQLASKMRFVSAQLIALLEGDLWIRSARHSNAMAARLAAAVGDLPGVQITQPVQANAVFAIIDPAVADRLRQQVPVLRLESGHRRGPLDVRLRHHARRRRHLRCGGGIGARIRMTEDEVIEFVSNLPGVVAMTAGPENGAPESAWGDSFFFYDPAGDTPDDRRFPFATMVVSDYAGFDTSSKLNRPGVFRLNINVGRTEFAELIGYPPAAHADNAERFDYSALDQLIPHPVYATQGWVSILNPGETSDTARRLLTQAHARAVSRHRHR